MLLLQSRTGRHKPPELPTKIRVGAFENLSDPKSNGDAAAPPHSKLLTPLTQDHIACTWTRRALLIGGTTNNCSSANGDLLPSTGSLGSLVQSLQKVADYFTHWYLAKIGFTLQLLILTIIQSKRKYFFSCSSHTTILSSQSGLQWFTSSIADNFYPLHCRKQPGNGYAVHFSPKRNIHEYITSVGTPYHTSRCMAVGNLLELPRGSPKHYIVPFRRGGAVMQDQQPRFYFESIPAGREGYVYLIHAEGTTRYKIGRSVNPIVRHQELQKQSPYPLKIVKSFWTLDAITDEDWIHKHYAEYRVFGEWFDLCDSLIAKSWGKRILEMQRAFENSYTMSSLASVAFKCLRAKLDIGDESCFSLGASILDLYCSRLTSRQELIHAEKFIRETLLELIFDVGFNSSDVIDGEPSRVLDGFMHGAFRTYVRVSLNRSLM